MGHSNSLNLPTITSIVLISGFFFPRRLEYSYLFSTGRYGGRGCFLKYSKILSETQVFWFDPNFNAVLKVAQQHGARKYGIKFHT